jgi:hypothetical protein
MMDRRERELYGILIYSDFYEPLWFGFVLSKSFRRHGVIMAHMSGRLGVMIHDSSSATKRELDVGLTLVFRNREQRTQGTSFAARHHSFS